MELGFLNKNRIKVWFFSYYLDVFMIFAIPLISLWGFLFVHGYYFYSDQTWPLSTYAYTSGVLSLNPLDGFSFSRLIVGWPYYAITLFTNNIQITERLFIYYTFILYTFSAYIFASLITSQLLKTRNKYEIKLIKFIIVLFIFVNFTALNLNSDGGSFADGLNIIFIAITLFIFVSWKNMRNAFFVSTFLLTISVLVEPDYITFFIVSIILGSIIAGILNKDVVYRLKYAIMSGIFTIVPILFIMYETYLTSSPSNTAISVGVPRVFSYGAILINSRNLKPLYPLILIGHLWSTIVYAPPNILFYGTKISNIKSLMSPSQLLLPPGFITEVWLLTLIMIPTLSLMSIAFKSSRRIAIPVIVLFAVFYFMALVSYIKPLFDIELYVSSLPIIGSAIGTTLTLPGHIINVIAAMYYIMFSISIINLFNKSGTLNIIIRYSKEPEESDSRNVARHRERQISIKRGQLKVAISVFVLFVVLFSGWQAFDGTFSPARAPDTVIGNHVSIIGGFTPVQVNCSVVNAYEYIASQNTDFNILWIGGPAYNNRVFDLPHPSAIIPDLSYVTSNNMTCAFYYDLLSSNVKYIVISNQNIEKDAASIFELTFNDAGFSNFTYAQSFLDNVSGLNKIYDRKQVVIYQVEGFSGIYKSNLLVNYNGSNQDIVGLPYLFSLMKYNASFTDTNAGINFFINRNLSNSVETPTYIASDLIKEDHGIFYNLTSNNNLSGYGHNYAIKLYNNYTLTLWSNNYTKYNYSNETVSMLMSGDYAFGTSISYNGSFDSGAGGFYDNGNCVKLTVTFYAKSTQNGSDNIIFMGEPQSNLSTDNVYKGINFNVTTSYIKYSISYIFSSTEQYVDFRLFDLNPGTFYVKDLSTEYFILPKVVKNSHMPFGKNVVLTNSLLKGNNATALVFMKNDTMNNFKWIIFNYSRGLNISNGTKIGAMVLLSNITVLNSRNKTYIVSIEPSVRAYILEYGGKYYSSISGIFGNSIFVVDGSLSSLDHVKIVTTGTLILNSFYIGIITYLLLMLYLIVRFYRRNKLNSR